ncbi:class I SAM-dependent methyltransferase [Bacteriovorax stolpii]|uniref:SAM-dependent methyltransferase n=1 Tax=Bacteriovorax stolpii TaxID=960 RepID=A0A2K9NWK3_BACTC|nr:SAM-dependent methyltransferase [Bacteriovorax stolpii]AUN99892.1 SAM-dependent methyltransferase [Bacteriovorax stolpii]QDK40115.1 class I SAM-dependent methyltransferase [Bacteriovorax stolpii]
MEKEPLAPMMSAIIHFTNALYDPQCFELIKKEEIRDVLSKGQLESKMWLLSEFKQIFKNNPHLDNLKTIVVGGWIGILARALNESDKRITADTVDIDPNATTIARLTLDLDRGKAFTMDMFDLDYRSYQCVVNTSTEHILNLKAWSDNLPKGTFVVAQNNNGHKISGHVNCVNSSEELEKLLGLSEIYYTGTKAFSLYDRFMVIGRK